MKQYTVSGKWYSMPNITENLELKQYFLTNLSKMYDDKERNGIHVSDLVYCLRKTFFRKVRPVPQNLQSLFYFLDGEQRHKGFQGLVPTLQNEVEVENFGIVGTMDLVFGGEQEGNFTFNGVEGLFYRPIEIKTTRAKPKGSIPPHYLRQGAYYCLLRETKGFTLLTQHINHQEIVFMDINFTDQELAEYKADMIRDRNLLKNAYKTNNPDKLPLASPTMSWLCKSSSGKCDYYEYCYVEKT
jgi:CRISPR/Cas system-associated exonuclease Cas4 (RecB family)